ncbi:PilZ domain-containing protein [Sphingobium aquiterrae]|uniref:PilZ domain-containing protein n=1 Tax=Sphingobium aquiterrae TaxID=2038656 RepID=UPI00301A4A23
MQRLPLEHRRVERALVDHQAQLSTRTGVHAVRIVNISPLGLMARCPAELMVGQRVHFILPHVPPLAADVRWCEDSRIGVEFPMAMEPSPYAMMLSAMTRRQNSW